MTKSLNATHGETGSATYTSWRAARERCRNPNSHKYAAYGGRGIKFCSHWDDFEVFVRDMGERPTGHTLDRIDPDGDYTPKNCRWASVTTQASNKRTSKRTIWHGSPMTIKDIAKTEGIPRTSLNKAFCRTYDIKKAVEYTKQHMKGRLP